MFNLIWWCIEEIKKLLARVSNNDANIGLLKVLIANIQVSGGPVGVYNVDTIIAMKALPMTPTPIRAFTFGRFSKDDGGFGEYIWDSTSTATADDNFIVALTANASNPGRFRRFFPN